MKKIIIFILLLFTPTVYAQDLLFNQSIKGVKNPNKVVSVSGETISFMDLINSERPGLVFSSSLGGAAYVVRDGSVFPEFEGYNAFGFTNKLSKNEIVVPKFLGKDAIYYFWNSNSNTSYYHYTLMYTKPIYKVTCDVNNKCSIIMELDATDILELIEGLEALQSMTFDIYSEEYDLNNIKTTWLYSNKSMNNHVRITIDDFNTNRTINDPESVDYYRKKAIEYLNGVNVTYAKIRTDYEITRDMPDSIDYGHIEYEIEPKTTTYFDYYTTFYESLKNEEIGNGMLRDTTATEILAEPSSNYIKVEFPIVTFDISPKEDNNLGGIVSLKDLSIGVRTSSDEEENLLSLKAESMPFNNKVEVIPEVKGVEENPKTGLFNTLLLIVPIILLVYGSYKLYKLRLFKKM